MLSTTEIRPDIHWVGAVDWNERLFHGYTTEKGLTYNAYLILDEKITLIDAVKAPFADDLIQRISQIVDPAKIDYVIANHVEMDHSGALPKVAEACPNATFICSTKGAPEMAAHFGDGIKWQTVKTGDTLSIGKRELTFVETTMVHWPDNMVTYDAYDKILFSNDAFGQHFASSGRFDTDSDLCEVMKQARKYYANIVQPYGMQAGRALSVVKDLDLTMIAPSHGVIWTEHIPDILEAYTIWVADTRTDKAVVLYDSMWGSTEAMAHAIFEAFVAEDIECRYYDVKETHESDIVAYAMDAKYICVGSPTLNMRMMPNIAKVLTYMLGLSPRNQTRVGLAFGSYGWAPVGPKSVAEMMAATGFQMPLDPITLNWRPTPEYLDGLQDQVRSLIEQAE